MSHPTSASNPSKRASSPHSSAPSAAAAAAVPILPAMKKAKSQPPEGNKNGEQQHVHFSDIPALSPMIEDGPNNAVLDASSPSSAFGRSSSASAGGVTANLSRKKATPPQPTKKLVIKLNKGLCSSGF